MTAIADALRSPDLLGVRVIPRSAEYKDEVLQIATRALGVRPQRNASGVQLTPGQAHTVWLADGGERINWSPEAILFTENRVHVQRHYREVRTQISEISRAGVQEARRQLDADDRLEKLDDHQIINVAVMTLPNSPGLCLFDEQGAGKTVSMIYAFDQLVSRDEVDFLLIVAPKSMIGEWPKDFDKFTGDLYRVLVAAGTPKEKRHALRQRADVVITNFETAVSMERDLEAHLRSYEGRAAIAVDESFFIKSSDARRTMALRRLREWCHRGFVLCGTPAPNSPSDLVEQFNFVDFGVTFEGVLVPHERVDALPVVQNVIQSRGLYLRSVKASVLPDLPPRRFQQVLLEMAPDQARLYVECLSELREDLERMDEEQFKSEFMNYLARRAALLQICSNPVAIDPTYDEIPAKIGALDRLLENLIEGQNEKVILWSFYTGSIDRLMNRYAHYGAIRYDGAITSVDERRDGVRRFQEDDAVKLFVANPAAAGAGLTLHSARFAIYESMSNQAAHYLQSLDRIHRRGQSRAVEYIVLLCRGTVEEEEYRRLLRKQEHAQDLLGDPAERNVTRSEALAKVSLSLADPVLTQLIKRGHRHG